MGLKPCSVTKKKPVSSNLSVNLVINLKRDIQSLIRIYWLNSLSVINIYPLERTEINHVILPKNLPCFIKVPNRGGKTVR